MTITKQELKKHIADLREFAAKPVFDVGDYRRQILEAAEYYEGVLGRMNGETKNSVDKN